MAIVHRMHSKAWFPIPLLIAGMSLLSMVDLRQSYESPGLMVALRVVFSTSVSLFVAYLASLSFLVRSTPGLLMLGCGAVVWGCSGVVAAQAGQHDANVVVTVHNLGAWVSAVCHLAGVAMSLRPRRTMRAASLWLFAVYAGSVLAVGLVTAAALKGWTPIFYVQGQGGTPLRQIVLGSAVAMFALAAVLLRATGDSNRSRFRYWYSLSLALVATGLFGVMLSSHFGSVLGWAGRVTQFLSGVYMLVAAIASVRESRAWGIPLEAALQDSESRYEALFASSLDAILLTDADGAIIAANPAACSLFRMSQEDFANANRASLVDPGGISLSEAMEEQRRVGGLRAELKYVRKDGTRFDGELTSTVLDSKGRSFDIIRDVTDRKRAEDALRALERDSALRANESKFRALMERSTDMINLLDEGGAIRFWSPGATAALGWAEEDVLGRQGVELAHPADQSLAALALQTLLSGPGSTARFTARFGHKDGSWRLVESVARNLVHDPVVQGIVVNSRDVTEQHRLQEELQHSRKMESIGRLAGGIAHDFNNLLTVILSGADELKRDQRNGTQSDADVIEEIGAAGRRARDLTRQLLAFARRQIIAPEPLDLNTLLRGSGKLLRRLMGGNVELLLNTQPDLWFVRCDPGQVEQVVMNLAVNARDAMPSGGTLTIETANVEVDDKVTVLHPFMRPGAYVRLSMQDSGQGLSPEVKAHLFEPFFTTKPVGQGTGLGLATVYGIVKQAEGYILANSERGQGTRFDLFFPRTLEAPVEAAVDDRPAAASTRSSAA